MSNYTSIGYVGRPLYSNVLGCACRHTTELALLPTPSKIIRLTGDYTNSTAEKIRSVENYVDERCLSTDRQYSLRWLKEIIQMISFILLNLRYTYMPFGR